METVYHIPALLEPTVSGLLTRPDGVYADLTFGGGGHSRAILARLNDKGRLYSFDRDMDAYANAGDSSDDRRWQFVHSDFRYLTQFMDYYGVPALDGILADLGVSFHHFDTAERGFSFRFAGPLDMRMNRSGGKTAADIVNRYTEEELARVLYVYGELKQSRPLAGRLVQVRSTQPIERTEQLVAALTGGKTDPQLLSPAQKKELTLAFQALRIEVNDELGALRTMLQSAAGLLRQGGRIAILTYHSLEDRLVKNFFKTGNLDGILEKDFYGNSLTPFRLIEKGLTADEDEVARNARARSAKLRIAEKR